MSPSLQRPLQQSVFVDGRRVTRSEMDDSVSVTAGRSFIVEASLYGKPSPSISWTFNGAQITTGGRITISTSTVEHLTVSRLTVSNADGNNDAGSYGVETDGVPSVSDTVNIVVQRK